MLNLTFGSFFLLSMAFLSLPLHSTPVSLGMAILLIVVGLLSFFVSLNMTLVAIFITLVYISGILILFSYFFSLIQNTKIFFIPTLVTLFFVFIFLCTVFFQWANLFLSKMIFVSKFSLMSSFLWILENSALMMFLVMILLLSMLFIEKVIGLKQKPLRVK